jgi:hypothetical protein
MKYAVEMGSGAITLSLMKIGSGIQKLIEEEGRYTGTQTAR